MQHLRVQGPLRRIPGPGLRCMRRSPGGGPGMPVRSGWWPKPSEPTRRVGLGWSSVAGTGRISAARGRPPVVRSRGVQHQAGLVGRGRRRRSCISMPLPILWKGPMIRRSCRETKVSARNRWCAFGSCRPSELNLHHPRQSRTTTGPLRASMATQIRPLAGCPGRDVSRMCPATDREPLRNIGRCWAVKTARQDAS